MDWHLKMMAACFFEMPGTTHPTTQRYIPEDLTPQFYVLFMQCFWWQNDTRGIVASRSSGTNPCDFYLWCLLKDDVYSSDHSTEYDLNENIKM